jgi:IS1 family transposase
MFSRHESDDYSFHFRRHHHSISKMLTHSLGLCIKALCERTRSQYSPWNVQQSIESRKRLYQNFLPLYCVSPFCSLIPSSRIMGIKSVQKVVKSWQKTKQGNKMYEIHSHRDMTERKWGLRSFLGNRVINYFCCFLRELWSFFSIHSSQTHDIKLIFYRNEHLHGLFLTKLELNMELRHVWCWARVREREKSIWRQSEKLAKFEDCNLRGRKTVDRLERLWDLGESDHFKWSSQEKTRGFSCNETSFTNSKSPPSQSLHSSQMQRRVQGKETWR